MKKKKAPKKNYDKALSASKIKAKEPKETVSFDALMRNIMTVKVEKK